MRVENDNISTAISPDGRTVIMVDDLDRNQVEAILLYLFGMVDAVQTVTNHMVMSLAQGNLSADQVATLARWRGTINEIVEFSSNEVQRLSAKPTTKTRRGRKVPIEQDRDLLAFFAEAVGVLSPAEAQERCVAKFGKERTPSKASINRFWLRVSKARKAPFN